MNQIKREVQQHLSLGKEFIIRSQYDKAYDAYNKALKYNADHYLTRNALAEVYFIQKEFISAADNFWLAAVDQSSRINFNLLNNEKLENFRLVKMREKEILRAQNILLNYSKKTGLSLFANQYENPLKKSAQQAVINLYRQEIDPCGYQGYTDANPEIINRIERNIQMIGYRFLEKNEFRKIRK